MREKSVLIRIFGMPKALQDEEVKGRIRRSIAARFGLDEKTMGVSFSPQQTDAHPNLRVLITGITAEQHYVYRTLVIIAGVTCTAYMAQRGEQLHGYENPQIAIPLSARKIMREALLW